MGSNTREFSLNLGRFAQGGEVRFHQLHRALVLELLSRIILASPVDTGRFRANWQISHGSPVGGESSGPRGPRVADGGDRDANAAAAARAALDSGVVEVAAIRPFEVTFLVNNVPYAASLADGASRQAPPGWVEAIVEGLLLWAETGGVR